MQTSSFKSADDAHCWDHVLRFQRSWIAAPIPGKKHPCFCGLDVWFFAFYWRTTMIFLRAFANDSKLGCVAETLLLVSLS
jgi:hypothetical protein